MQLPVKSSQLGLIIYFFAKRTITARPLARSAYAFLRHTWNSAKKKSSRGIKRKRLNSNAQSIKICFYKPSTLKYIRKREAIAELVIIVMTWKRREDAQREKKKKTYILFGATQPFAINHPMCESLFGSATQSGTVRVCVCY